MSLYMNSRCHGAISLRVCICHTNLNRLGSNQSPGTNSVNASHLELGQNQGQVSLQEYQTDMDYRLDSRMRKQQSLARRKIAIGEHKLYNCNTEYCNGIMQMPTNLTKRVCSCKRILFGKGRVNIFITGFADKEYFVSCYFIKFQNY